MVKSRKGKGYYKRCYWFKRGSNKRVTTKRRTRRRYTRRNPYPKTTYFGPSNYDSTLDLPEDAPSVFLTPSMEAELPPPPPFLLGPAAAKARRKSRKSKRRSKRRSKRKSRKSSKRRKTSKRRRRY